MRNAKPTLLVVDDDDAVLQTMARLLRHFGFDVVALNDSVQALRVLQAHEGLAGLVCDFEMPGINGEQLARAAKSKEAHMPVFICSGTYPPDLNSPPWDGWFLKGAHVIELIRQLQEVTLPLQEDFECRPPAPRV